MVTTLPLVSSRERVRNVLRVVSLYFLVNLACSESFGQAVFLGDLNQREETDEFEFSGLRAGNEKIFVVVRGRELWTSYLAENNEDVIVKLGAYDAISNVTVVGEHVYFTASTSDRGMELYWSDGTPEGTRLIRDINPGTAGSDPQSLVDVGGTLYFSAVTGLSGRELWKSGGTATSTVQVKEIFPKTGSSNPASLTDVNGTLFFSANDGSHGYELWKSDGTPDGTVLVRDIKSAPRVGSIPDDLTNVEGTLYFSAIESATGRELYKSDGTATGTVLVRDVRAGAASSDIENLTANGSTLVFTASDGLNGAELWKSDGTSAGTVLLKDMTPGPPGSHGEQSGQHRMGNFASINGIVYYTAYQGNTYMIWKTDGTTEGTSAIMPSYGAIREMPRPKFVGMNGHIYFYNAPWPETWSYTLMRMNPDGSNPEYIYDVYVNYTGDLYSPELVAVQDRNGDSHLYYYGIVAFMGYELLKSSGTGDYEETYFLPDPYEATASSNPHHFTRRNNMTYFIANPTWYDNQSLWVADGNFVEEVIWFSYNAGEYAFTENKLYASGKDWLELYRSDGTPYAQEYIADDYNGLPAIHLTGVKSKMFFTNADAALYVVDDANRDMIFLRDFEEIYDFQAVGSNLVFRSRNAAGGEELWRSNGTPSGTIRYATIAPAFETMPLYRPSATINTNTHYFIANDGIHGNELWRTQGSRVTTYMVADLNPNDHQYMKGGKEHDIRSIYEFRDSLYISAIDHTGSWSLLKTNGRADGFVKVLAMNEIVEMVEVYGKLYLFALDSVNNEALNVFVTNGTAGGTKFLFQLPTLEYSHATVANALHVRMAGSGSEVWRTDGTACGTFSFDLGVTASNDLGAYGNNLIFAGLHPDKGIEPYYIDPASFIEPCDPATQVAAAAPATLMMGNEQLANIYPNPFENELVLRISGNDQKEVRVEVYTITGARVDELPALKSNTDYSIGANWPQGVYVLKINAGGTITTQKVVKRN